MLFCSFLSEYYVALCWVEPRRITACLMCRGTQLPRGVLNCHSLLCITSVLWKDALNLLIT